MGFWDNVQNLCNAFCTVVDDILDIIDRAVVWLVDVVFSLAEHLIAWIGDAVDDLINSGILSELLIGGGKVSSITISPEMVQPAIDKAIQQGKITTGPAFKRKNAAVATVVQDGKVVKAQVVGSSQGFDRDLQSTFNKGHVYKVPIENS